MAKKYYIIKKYDRVYNRYTIEKVRFFNWEDAEFFCQKKNNSQLNGIYYDYTWEEVVEDGNT